MLGTTKKPMKPDTSSDNAANRIAKGTTFEGVRGDNNVRIDGV